MTKSKPNKKENKSKTSEEPTHRKPQQERISKIHDRVFVGVSGLATDVQTLGETTFSVLKRTWAVVTGGWSCLGV
ncbi:hypothetical protein YC2023_042611 [Brassica napus]